MKRTLVCSLTMLVLLLGVMVPLANPAQAKPRSPAAAAEAKEKRKEHPAMSAALVSLMQAKKHLESAKPVFKGHREKAIELTNQAIEEVRAGLAAAEK